jgi:hypothetical protein
MFGKGKRGDDTKTILPTLAKREGNGCRESTVRVNSDYIDR